MPPKKKVAALVKVALQASSATPTPSVGTALGPHGVNIMEFVKACSAAAESQRGSAIPVEITIYGDCTFTFIAKAPPAAKLTEETAGIQSGSDNPLKNRVGKLTKNQVREITTMRLPDLNTNDVDAACKIAEDTACSISITVG